MSNEYAISSLSNKCTFFLGWCLPHLTFMRVIMICCHGCSSLIVDSWDITRLGKTRHLFLCTQRRLTLQSGLSLSLCCSSSLDYSFWGNSWIPWKKTRDKEMIWTRSSDWRSQRMASFPNHFLALRLLSRNPRKNIDTSAVSSSTPKTQQGLGRLDLFETTSLMWLQFKSDI